MRRFIYRLLTVSAGCAILALAGCGKKPAEPEAPVTPVYTGEMKTIAEMEESDVIVFVNGVPLTKQSFMVSAENIRKAFDERRDMDPEERSMMIRNLVKDLVPRFVSKQLLLKDATDRRVLSPEAVEAFADRQIAILAQHLKKTPEEFTKSLPDGGAAFRKIAAEEMWINATIASNVLPTVVKVDDAFMEDLRLALQEERENIAATNAMKVALLNAFREDVLAGGRLGGGRHARGPS